MQADPSDPVHLHSAVLELDFNGTVRYASKEWLPLTGIPSSRLVGRQIGEFVLGDRDIFDRAAAQMRAPNFKGGSVTVWVSMKDPESLIGAVEIEAQGILVDLKHFGDNAVIWLISRFHERPSVSVTLPDELVRTTGFATDVFASFLESLADAVRMQNPSLPAPPQALCRICEQFVKTWWFERHHWLCAVEHKDEDRLLAAIDLLLDHREDLHQIYAQFTVQAQQQLQPKHAVHVPSPLARSVTPNSANSPVSVPQPISGLQAAVIGLIDRCDAIVELDPATVEAKTDRTDSESLYGLNNARILDAYHKWEPLPVPMALEGSYDTTERLMENVVSNFERYAKFLRYKRVLWQEVEAQVVVAIEATIAAAESTDATVVIDHEQADVPELDLAEEVVYSDDEDEMKYILNLKRQRSVHSRRSSSEQSPHFSPYPRVGRSIGSMGSQQDALRRLSTASLLSGVSTSPHESHTADYFEPITVQSIKDYEIVKPISRGAYGVVYLARKRLTGEIFAIKVLQKSQMVAKNQVTHIKHERRTLISTTRSPYVATLFYSFQSRDYLYLVMEYVMGGDVAALLKKTGCLSEALAKQYISEVVVAVDSLHSQGILHRDLKPDNLLIDKFGHIKLSDFGLSAPKANTRLNKIKSRTSSFGSQGGGQGSRQSSPTPASPLLEPTPVRILGTPDYLAPETIEGNVELTEAADWWSVGCIFFELVYGYPPFNDESPSKIFANILRGKFEFPELPEELDVSFEAKNLIRSLLQVDAKARLGSNGSLEVMEHPYFGGIDAAELFKQVPEYIPEATNPLSTSNFDDRGANSSVLPTQETNLIYSHSRSQSVSSTNTNLATTGRSNSVILQQRENSLSSKSSMEILNSAPNSGQPDSGHVRRDSRNSESSVEGFGNFAYRNLPVLERANNEVITKIRDEDRRLSFSGQVSPVILPSSPSHSVGSPVSERNMLLQPANDYAIEDLPRASSPGLILTGPPPSKSPQIEPETLYTQPHPLSSTSTSKSSSSTSVSSQHLMVPQSQSQPQSEDPEKELVMLRMRRRQQLRKLPSTPFIGKQGTPHLLVCGPPSLSAKFVKLGCKVLACQAANDVCIYATGPTQYSLIVIDLPETSPIPDTEVVRIIRGTVNPNRDIPIVKACLEPSTDLSLPSFNPADNAEVHKLLKVFCNWSPT